MPEIRIEPARESDTPIVLDFIRALAAYEKLEHEVVATEQDIREWLFGARPVAEAAIAYAGGTPVAFALFFRSFSTFAGRPGLYLEDLFVLPEWRGRGVGRRLMIHLARLAVERGYARMEWAVLDWNEPAIGFYRRLGARVLEDWRTCRLAGHALDDLASAVTDD